MSDMNNENCLMIDRYERIQKATLNIQGKKYSVYKGVNTIGRNKSAIINVKNLNVSQHHAAIIIVDDTQHFITDLNSSNGTYLLDTKLLPYKLYELPNDVQLKFGDAIASYLKVSNTDSTIRLETENFDMTQNMTQTFYGANTQLMVNESCLYQTGVSRTSHTDIEDIHEAATQVVSYPSRLPNKFNEDSESNTNYSVETLNNDIHDAPTQIVDYRQASTSKGITNVPDKEILSSLPQKSNVNYLEEMDIHEMETQVVTYNPQEVIEKITSSLTVKNVGSAECSSRPNKNNRNDFDNSFAQVQKKSNISTVIEETVIEETVEENHPEDINESSNDSFDFLGTRKCFQNESVTCNQATDTKDDRVSIFSDSQDITVPRKRPVRKLSSSEDLSQSRDDKVLYNSDSDTNMDNEIVMKKTEIDPSIKKQLIDSGSDTDIEDVVPEQLKSKIESVNSDSETDIEDNIPQNVLIQSQDVIKPKILTKKRLLDSDSDTDIEDNKEEEFVPEASRKENSNTAEILNDTDCIPATQDAFGEIFMFKDSKLSKSNINSQNVSSEESFKLGLTELMTDSFENKADNNTNEEDKENIINNDKSYNTIDVKINGDSSDTNDQISNLSEKNKEDVPKVIENDEISTNVSKGHKELQNAQNEIHKKVNMYQNNLLNIPNTTNTVEVPKDDFYIMPTQKLDENLESKKSISAPTGTVEIPKDDFYIMPTQKLEENLEIKKIISVPTTSKGINLEEQIEEDFYIMPTQKLDENLVNKEIISVATTSKAINGEKEIEDIYMMPTQNLNDNENQTQFKTPQKRYNYKKKGMKSKNIFRNSAVTQNVHEGKDEDIYLQATQKLDENPKNRELHQRSAHDLNLEINTQTNKDEEDFYMAPTQRIEINLEERTAPEKIDENLALESISLGESMKEVSRSESVPDLILQPTQDVNLNSNTLKVSKNEETLYMAPTQQIDINLEESNKKFQDNLSFKIPSKCTKRKHEDPYLAETQPTSPNLETEEVNTVCLGKPVQSDLYLQETQCLDLSKNLMSNKNEENEDLYLASMQQINHDLDDISTKSVLGESSLGKQGLNSDLNTRGSKTAKESNVETLSQIDAFIKQPFIEPAKKSNMRVEQSHSKTKRKVKETNQSETLSQIERFVKEPFDNSKKQKTKTPRKGSLSRMPQDEAVARATDPSETLNQIKAVVKIPSTTNTKESVESGKVASKREEILFDKQFQVPEQLNTRSKRGKPAIPSTSHVSKEECITVYKSEAEHSTNSEKTSTLGDDQESVKSDVEKSFALLEAKSKKTRKSQRLTDSVEIKVRNRRSMITSVIPESSDNDGTKLSTRKSRKKSTTINNNNNCTVISENTDNKRSVRSKRKFEADGMKEAKTEKCESVKPSKMLRKNATVSSKNTTVKSNQEEETNIFSPSTSRINSKTSKQSSDNGSFTSSNESILSTPSRRNRRTIQNNTVLTSAEKMKRKQKPKIVFTMLDSPHLESLIRQMGGSVVDSVESSTVLITEHVKRSQKLLAAIGQGKPICSPEWLHASKKANEFLDPWNFILVDKEAESKWTFSLDESISRAKNEKLLGNYTFQLMINNNNAVDVLKGAIEACGGKCVPRYPAKQTEGFFVIVASPENRSKYLKIKKQHPQITVVEPEAIFDGVLRQDLRLGRHLLT